MQTIFSTIKKWVPNETRQRVTDALIKIQYGCLRIMFAIPELISRRYITLHSRPKNARDVRITYDAKRDYSDYAIILQGPIRTADRFTLESIYLYQKHFPGAFIVLSTWEGEDVASVQAARNAGIEVLLNKKPPVPGLVNVNMQLVTSRAGVASARDHGKSFAVKTRTDQRFYSPFALSYMSNLVKEFPAARPHTGRIGGISANSILHKLYQFPDLLIFGHTADVLQYFSAEPVDNDAKLSFLDPKRPFTAECYLCSEYAKKIGYTLKYTREDFLTFVAEQCIIADTSALDWFWFKTGSHYRRFFQARRGMYTDRKYHIDFSDWLDLYRSHFKTSL